MIEVRKLWNSLVSHRVSFIRGKSRSARIPVTLCHDGGGTRSRIRGTSRIKPTSAFASVGGSIVAQVMLVNAYRH